jgi:hypothetical protein
MASSTSSTRYSCLNKAASTDTTQPQRDALGRPVSVWAAARRRDDHFPPYADAEPLRQEEKPMSDDITTWPELAIALYDKLTGRGAEVTYEFEQLEVFVPSKVDADPKTAKWTLNGTLKIRTRDTGTS